jgi:hypothetical protein
MVRHSIRTGCKTIVDPDHTKNLKPWLERGSGTKP